MEVFGAAKGEGADVILLGTGAMPPVGAQVRQPLDWERHRHMRLHTALRLLSVVIPLPVTGGQIGTGRGGAIPT